MKKVCLSLLWLVHTFVLPAQVNKDSLWVLWHDPVQADTIRLKAIQEIAWSMLYSNPDSAAILAQAQLALARTVDNVKWQGKALNVVGGVHHVKGNYPAALKEYEKALAAFQQAGELRSTASMFNNIGLIYREQGSSSRALEYYLQYLEIGERLLDSNILSTAFNNLGTLYSDQFNFDKALEYYEKGLELAEKRNDKPGMAIGHNNVGSIYFTRKDYARALERYRKSLVLRTELNDQRGIAFAYVNCGILYKEQKDYRQAFDYFQKARAIQEQMGDKPNLATLYHNIGSTNNAQQAYAEGAAWCAKGLALSEQIGALRPARNACECLYEAYKGMGNTARALTWHERYVALNDSLQKEEMNKRLAQMEFAKQVMADSLGREEESLKMEVAYRKEVRKKDRMMSVLLITGLFVLALALGFWSRMLYFRRHSELFQSKAEQLEKQQLLNEIALLKTQVNPHFLFNSLSILSSLVRANPDLAEQFIDQLSRSYRYILEQKEQSLVTLRTELEFIRSYTFLLKIRFENKFDLRFHLSDAVLDRYKIAPLTLQLLVENAVKHNRMSVKEPLVVDVSFEADDMLVVRNRLQPRSASQDSTGLGLQNIVDRYALLTDRLVWAGEQGDAFVVKVPLL